MSVSVCAAAWVLSAIAAFVLLSHPVSVDAQLMLGLGVIGAMIAVWRLPRTRFNRQLFLALGGFVVIRYLYWRLTSTLPPASDPVGLAFGVLVLLAELYCVLILAISLTISAEPLNRRPLERDPDDQLPTVDVFIPSYNEDESILATTMAAAMSMDYPRDKLTVWLLDDGGTDQKCNDANPAKAEAARQRRAVLSSLCAQMGAQYLTRARNEHAKAGNLNNGLTQSQGEIVVVFDADHAPFRSFLRETIGHFARDPKLFLVQTPHVFLNPDPIEKNLRTFDRMPSENEMFYSSIQRGLDKWNGSFFCGSAALLRRSALATVGGFSGITITEDCETALDLHSQGWTSVFVDKPLIAGLQPETFASFIGQRSRWCQGMMQIFLLKNPIFKQGLRPIQKAAYLSSMTFWLFPMPRLVFMLAPLLFILLDIKVFVSNLDEAIAYTATYMVVNLMMQNYLYGKLRWPWISELYEYIQGVFLSKALVSVVANPRKPTFNVTAKGLSLENDHLSELAWPFFLIYGLLLAGGGVSVWRYFNEPAVSELMVVVGLWNLFNLLIAGAALGAVAERRQADRHPRLGISRQGHLFVDGVPVAVDVVNVSAGGCALALADKAPVELRPGVTRGLLTIESFSGVIAPSDALPLALKRMSAADGRAIYGFQFEELSPRGYYVLADLMYGDSEALPRFLASRRKHKSIFAGSWQFVVWGVIEPVRAAAYALRRDGAAPAAEEGAHPQPATHWLRTLVAAGRTPSVQSETSNTGVKVA